jgi:hypothetical protein
MWLIFLTVPILGVIFQQLPKGAGKQIVGSYVLHVQNSDALGLGS